jgi:hypothetical protein
MCCWDRVLAWLGLAGLGWVGLDWIETTGTLEPLRNLTGLIYVDMSTNSIGGTSSRDLTTLTWLTVLSVYSNALIGMLRQMHFDVLVLVFAD